MSRVKLQTSLGDIVLELDAAKAPGSVGTSCSTSTTGFYDNTVFHRVITGFMSRARIRARHEAEDHQSANRNEAESGPPRTTPTPLRWRAHPTPHSATAQFFIKSPTTIFSTPRRPPRTVTATRVFGRVVEGREVVDKIKGCATGSSAWHPDVPKEDVVITKGRIMRARKLGRQKDEGEVKNQRLRHPTSREPDSTGCSGSLPL